jgi:hypothetical protein
MAITRIVGVLIPRRITRHIVGVLLLLLLLMSTLKHLLKKLKLCMRRGSKEPRTQKE